MSKKERPMSFRKYRRWWFRDTPRNYSPVLAATYRRLVRDSFRAHLIRSRIPSNPMTPQIKPDYKTTYHRDGTVSFWSVYSRQWKRRSVTNIPGVDLASLNEVERRRISRMAKALPA